MTRYTGEVHKKEFCRLLHDILKGKQMHKNWNVDIIMSLFKKGDTKIVQIIEELTYQV